MTDQTITCAATKQMRVEAVAQPEYKTFFRSVITNHYADGRCEVLHIFEGGLKYVTALGCIAFAGEFELSPEELVAHLDEAKETEAARR